MLLPRFIWLLILVVSSKNRPWACPSWSILKVCMHAIVMLLPGCRVFVIFIHDQGAVVQKVYCCFSLQRKKPEVFLNLFFNSLLFPEFPSGSSSSVVCMSGRHAGIILFEKHNEVEL
jgi:hypothetical protein